MSRVGYKRSVYCSFPSVTKVFVLPLYKSTVYTLSMKWKMQIKVWLFSSININHNILQLQVVLQKCKVKSLMHSPGDYILLSADKYEIKVCTVYHTYIILIPREIKCLSASLKFTNRRLYFLPYCLLVKLCTRHATLWKLTFQCFPSCLDLNDSSTWMVMQKVSAFSACLMC